MATIALYKDKLNSMPNLITGLQSSINSCKGDLFSLSVNTLLVDSSICNMDEVARELRSATDTLEDRVEKLEHFHDSIEDFIQLTVDTDQDVADAVNQSKEDFYETYDYLKPDAEKSGWEKFCDGVKAAADWCKDHWKLIVTAVLVVVSVVVLCIPGIGPLLTAACWGAIIGAAVGGTVGGISSYINGGAFLEGFEQGAFNGAISGAIGGAISGGFVHILGPASTLLGSIGQGAGIGAISSGVSNVAVTGLNYYIDHGTLKGSGPLILRAAISGAISGGIMGGLMGGLNFYKSQMKVSDTRYLNDDGSVDWDTYAPNNGRVEGTTVENQTISKGTVIDRYGPKYGRYASPKGTGYDSRALPYEQNSWAYHKYVVVKDIPGVTTSEIAPAFGQLGGGIQFELPDRIVDLISNGFLRELFF